VEGGSGDQVGIPGQHAADDEGEINTRTDDPGLPGTRCRLPDRGRSHYTYFTLLVASSQSTFFWLLNDNVAMCPEIAACCPTVGGAITFSLPSTDWIKFLK